MSIRLEGFPEFLKLVEQMPDKLKKREMAAIIRRNLKPVADSIREIAPSRKTTNTIKRRSKKSGQVLAEYSAGNLKRSIGVRIFSRGEDVTGYAGPHNRKSADGYYGFFLERGTKTISPIRFIERAASVSAPKAKEELLNDINTHIVNSAKRLGLDAR